VLYLWVLYLWVLYLWVLYPEVPCQPLTQQILSMGATKP